MGMWCNLDSMAASGAVGCGFKSRHARFLTKISDLPRKPLELFGSPCASIAFEAAFIPIAGSGTCLTVLQCDAHHDDSDIWIVKVDLLLIFLLSGERLLCRIMALHRCVLIGLAHAWA